MSTISVSFCDLAHEGHSCNAIPLGISMVASYALAEFGDEIAAESFKYPTDYISYLEKEVPRIACFSNYIWNLNLSYEIARSIKGRSSGTMVASYSMEKFAGEINLEIFKYPVE